MKRRKDRKLIINVTEANILLGEKKCAYNCPISLALGGGVNGSVLVSPDKIRRRLSGRVSYYALPPEAKKFIEAFDKGESVTPITFECEEIKDNVSDI
jgi:hypothetical protein